MATLSAEINPVSANWVVSQIHAAEDQHAAAFVLQLDTPGGLSDSMEQIVHAELAAKIPVVVYVWPEGARAASAGFVILQAADVAALAPTTNAGSAIPISSTGSNIGSDLRSKIINDARAQVRALATAHGRNATLAEGAVTPRSAACPSCPLNWTAHEAVAANVADVVAPNLPDLLQQIDGRTLTFKHLTVHVAGARIDSHGVPWNVRLLLILTNANLLALLFLLGIVGIVFELTHPGIVLPGLLGGVSLLLALLGLSIVPFSWAGLALLALGLVLLGAEAHVPAHGAFAGRRAPGGSPRRCSSCSASTTRRTGASRRSRSCSSPRPSACFMLARGQEGRRSASRHRRCRPAARPSSAFRAIALTPLAPRGQVMVGGERWLAVADDGPYEPGDELVVTSVDGLRVHVASHMPAPQPGYDPPRSKVLATRVRGAR